MKPETTQPGVKAEELLSIMTAQAKMRLAAKIMTLIADNGWNKKQFAIKVNKQNSVVSRWLSGNHNFTVDTLLEIAAAFKIDVIDLLKENDPYKPLVY